MVMLLLFLSRDTYTPVIMIFYFLFILLVSKTFFIFPVSSSSSNSSLTTHATSTDSLESLADASNLISVKYTFTEYLKNYTLNTGIHVDPAQDEFYATIYTEAIFFASGLRSSFVDVVKNPHVSVPVHCFLLEVFTSILLQRSEISCSIYSDFIRFYSEYLAANYEITMGPIEIFNKNVFSLLNKLVQTGNFLNYSMLYSVCSPFLTETQKDILLKSHCSQYFEKLAVNAFDSLEFSVFQLGIDFMSLYHPRYDILSIFGFEASFLTANTHVFYYLALQPLRAVVNPMATPLNYEILAQISRISSRYCDTANENLFLKVIENVLKDVDFLNIRNFEQFKNRLSIFDALFRVSHIEKLVELGLVTTFQAWAQSEYLKSSHEQSQNANLRQACYNSPDPRFKLIFDELIAV